MAQAKYKEWLEEENLIKLEAWARDGLTDEQIANNIGITVRTLYNWKQKYVPIFQSLKRGKEVVDYEVENALLKKALGYEYVEEKTTQKIIDGKKVIEKTTQKKHQAPDTTAIIYWLKNRKRKVWRDKPDIYDIEKDISVIKIEQAQADLDKTKAEIQKIRGIAEEIEDLSDIEEEIYGED